MHVRRRGKVTPASPGTRAAQPPAPDRGFSFESWQVSNPTAPPPGNQLDAEFDRTNSAVAATQDWVATSLNTDGTLRSGVVGSSQLASGLYADLAAEIIAEVQPLVDQAGNYAGSASTSATAAQTAAGTAQSSSVGAANSASSAQTAAASAVSVGAAAAASAANAANSATTATNAANTATGSEAIAQDYAVVTQAWAEHMPDPIPPNILAVMGISGDHWSSRWWANQAAANVAAGVPGPPGPPGPPGAPGAAVGIGEAPPDGTIYGRQGNNASWHNVLGLATGGTVVAPVKITATGSPTSRSVQDRWGELDSVKDWGAIGDGVTDDTSAIQAAIAAVGPGCLRFPAGTYKISGTLTMPTMQRWQGASSGSTILQWAGGNNTEMVNTSLPAYADKGGIESMTLHAGSATGMTLLHLRNTHQSIYRNIYLDGNNGAGNVCLFLEAGAGGNNDNCCHSAFYHVIGRNSAKGLVITGASGNGATDNAFFFCDFSSTPGLSGYVGIELQQWCDSNLFYYTRITLWGANGICVWVGSMTPPSTPSAYDYTFSGIFLDNIGAVPNATGFKLGSMSGLYATGVFISPQPYTGLVIDADPVNSRSYYVATTNGNFAGTSVMQTYQKAFGDHPEPQLIVPGFTRTRGQLGGAAIGFANRLFATSIFIPYQCTLKTLSLSITAANTTSAWNVRMGVFADNGFGKPGALVAGTDNGILTIAQGSLSGETISLGAGVVLQRGLYWAAVVVDVIGASVLCSGPSGPSDAGTSSVNFPTALQGLGNGCFGAWTFGALPVPPAQFPSATISPGLDTPVVIMGL